MPREAASSVALRGKATVRRGSLVQGAAWQGSVGRGHVAHRTVEPGKAVNSKARF